jgi:mRNA-degrading endonuclease RelE of RelBE toxin-antitoxin system
MEFRIADTFTNSLARLTGEEQKAVKMTAFDLQLNPSNPGMSFHKLDRAKDKNFWSIRVNKDIRVIVHRTENSLMLCYVNHHDKAYEWAERRKLEVHPKTGAAQLVEIRETVKEIIVPVYINKENVQVESPKKLFAGISSDELLSYGVPEEWLKDVKEANDQSLLLLIDYLPSEAGEALLELATGGRPLIPKTFLTYKCLSEVSEPGSPYPNPFNHPDAQRRFRIMRDVQELERALEFPWDKWSIFLHPSQREFVDEQFAGPARVSGSAGTGKTIVALHRAVFLAKKYPGERILLTTFSSILSNSLKDKLRKLISNEPRLAEQIEVSGIDDLAIKLYTTNFSNPTLILGREFAALIKKTVEETEGCKLSVSFLLSEWEQVVDMWQLKNWESYKDFKRLGRKTRLSEKQRFVMWSIFEKVIDYLARNKLMTYAGIFQLLTSLYEKEKKSPFQHAVIDEAQDLTVYHLKFLAAFGNNQPETLFFAGDLGQRIFQQAFSWKAVGVDIKGRSKTLTVNYRTSHQIRQHTDKLLGLEVQDVDGNVEERNKTLSAFNGPEPIIRTFSSKIEENDFVGEWVADQVKNGTAVHEIGVFVRSDKQFNRAKLALQKAQIPYTMLDEAVELTSGKAIISTMHFAKGLEFKAVAVMACDDEIIPLQDRIESITDYADLEEVYNTERHLLYVACTRAREFLLVTGVEPSSEFLEDLLASH